VFLTLVLILVWCLCETRRFDLQSEVVGCPIMPCLRANLEQNSRVKLNVSEKG
jgi:hypothetical protein